MKSQASLFLQPRNHSFSTARQGSGDEVPLLGNHPRVFATRGYLFHPSAQSAPVAGEDLSETQLRRSSSARRQMSGTMTSNVFPFLQLPGDVRNTIYRLLLVDDKHVRMPCSSELSDDPEIRALQIFRLCRQVFREASSIFYEENVFDLSMGFLHNPANIVLDCPWGYHQRVRKISVHPYCLHDLVSPFMDLHANPSVCNMKANPFQIFVDLEEIKMHYRVPCYSKEHLKRFDSQLKEHLRRGRSIFGRISSAMPSVDLWLVETQIISTDSIVSGNTRGGSEIGEDARDDDDSDANTDETGTAHILKNLDIDDDDDSDTDMPDYEEELLYNQRVVLRQAILDPQDEHSVLLFPGLVGEWRYAPWSDRPRS